MSRGENPVTSEVKTYTLITGASLGLGRAFALECASRGRNLLLVSLPGEGLVDFCHEIEKNYGVTARFLETDLTLSDGPASVYQWAIPAYRVDMLINNAGLGGSKKYEESSLNYLDTIIFLNVRALALLTRYLLPELKSHSRSYVLNVSSIAAFSPVPFKTVYPASKSFVYSFSRGLREELKNTPVTVSVVHPGPVMTNAEVVERIYRQGLLARLTVLPAHDVARISIKNMLKGHPVITPGVFNKIYKWGMKCLPVGWRIRIASRALQREFLESRSRPASLKKIAVPDPARLHQKPFHHEHNCP